MMGATANKRDGASRFAAMDIRCLLWGAVLIQSEPIMP
jgi:hypothetical protein